MDPLIVPGGNAPRMDRIYTVIIRVFPKNCVWWAFINWFRWLSSFVALDVHSCALKRVGELLLTSFDSLK